MTAAETAPLEPMDPETCLYWFRLALEPLGRALARYRALEPVAYEDGVILVAALAWKVEQGIPALAISVMGDLWGSETERLSLGMGIPPELAARLRRPPTAGNTWVCVVDFFGKRAGLLEAVIPISD